MSGALRHLLKLGQKVQRELGAEEDPVRVAHLTNDLKLIKAEVGRRVLDMPDDEPVASIFTKPSPSRSKPSLVDHGSPRSVRKARRRVAEEPIPPEVASFISRKFAQFLAERLVPQSVARIASGTRRK
jgi:hypothetical protein